jgi:hypothetical protein
MVAYYDSLAVTFHYTEARRLYDQIDKIIECQAHSGTYDFKEYLELLDLKHSIHRFLSQKHKTNNRLPEAFK